MAFWVVRAGKHGENESYALERGVVAIGWDRLGDLTGLKEREQLQKLVSAKYPDEANSTTRVWTGELWALKERIQVGDWVALPLKSRSAIAIGRISGPYKFEPEGAEHAKHQRPVKWLRTDLPRADVDQDLLYSLGGTLTVFQVQRNNAEERFSQIMKSAGRPSTQDDDARETLDQNVAPIDLEQVAADQITDFIRRKYKGHELARLVEAILKAEGYQTLLSPPGADGGVDIIAGTGPMGFDRPRLAVQVKSSDSPVDVSVVRELQGVMPRFGADQGLVVSWGGYRESVVREARQLYFTIRLWDAGDLVAALQTRYRKLPQDIQTELPFKQLWTLAIE